MKIRKNGKVITLSETDLKKIVKRTLKSVNEQGVIQGAASDLGKSGDEDDIDKKNTLEKEKYYEKNPQKEIHSLWDIPENWQQNKVSFVQRHHGHRLRIYMNDGTLYEGDICQKK